MIMAESVYALKNLSANRCRRLSHCGCNAKEEMGEMQVDS